MTRRSELVVKIEALLKVHTTIEEEIFYPAVKAAGEKRDDDKMYFEALEEHRAAGFPTCWRQAWAASSSADGPRSSRS